MTRLLKTLLRLTEAPLALIVGYLLLLTGAAFCAARRTPARGRAPDRRFRFLVPAHDEEQLLPGLLENLWGLDYPQALYAVHVVADNCADRTAELARHAGALVHERNDSELIGKGYALQWLLHQIWESGEPHDAIVILDADSRISPNFLTIMDARLARGERAIQAYYAVHEPERSQSASLRAVALAALHYLRPLGRMTLGASAGLKGNGMVLAADLARQYPWPSSLTEDIEYHMALILGGQRVTFAPDAIVWAEMPDTLSASRTQNMRWERGRLQMLRGYAPRLLGEAWRRRSFMLFDAAVEQAIPPFSIIAASSACCVALAAALRDLPGALVGGLLLAGQAVYVLAGLMLARVPGRVYRALLYAPAFVAWKLWLYLRVIVGRDQTGWVRTARNDT